MYQGRSTSKTAAQLFTRSTLSLVCFVLISLLLTGMYLLLVITDSVPIAGFVSLVLLCSIYLVINQRLSYATPMDAILIAFLMLTPLSYAISSDKNLNLPKLIGLVLGIFIFYVIVNSIRTIRLLSPSILFLVFLSLSISAFAIFGADWSGSSYSLPIRIADLFSRLLNFPQNFTSGGGIHVNTIGGVLSFFVPFLISLLWDSHASKKALLGLKHNKTWLLWVYKLLVLVALFSVVLILFLTQSRGSYLGCVIGFLAVVIWKNPRFAWILPILIGITFIIIQVTANGNISEFIAILDTSPKNDTIPIRIDYWRRTAYLIQDFPFSGVGLGTYGKVFQELYTFTPSISQNGHQFYAHNMYLAIAAGLGIPALILFISLISSFASMIYFSFKKVHPFIRVVLIGLACGLLAHLVYGLWDNFILGEKLGFVMWVFLALITAIYIHRDNFYNNQDNQGRSTSEKQNHASNKILTKARIIDIIVCLGYWVLFSLIAISFVNLNVYVSLLIALLGGILLGILTTRRFESTTSRIIPDVNITVNHESANLIETGSIRS